jgi:acetyl-CoA synthetase
LAVFSASSLASRIQDCDAKLLITSKRVSAFRSSDPAQVTGDEALASCPSVTTQIVVRRTGDPVAMTPGRDLYWDEEMNTVGAYCEPEAMNAEDPLFILYTSAPQAHPKVSCTRRVAT